MEEAVSIFHSVLEAEQWNSRPHQKQPLEENENPASSSNQEHGVDKAIKRYKIVEFQPIAVGIDAGAEACGENLIEKGAINTGKKV